MPSNFELTWTTPLLLQVQNKGFKSANDWAKQLTQAYVDTIAQGNPIGISPTLPSPAASGAPAPVGTGPGDAFALPFVQTSQIRMEKVISVFAAQRDIALKQGYIKVKKETIKNAIRTAEYQSKLLKAQIQQVKNLSNQLKEVPLQIKQAIDGVKALFEHYINQFKTIKADLLGLSAEDLRTLDENFDINEQFKKTFPNEAKIIDSLTNLNITNISEVGNTFREIDEYLKNDGLTLEGFANSDEALNRQYAKRVMERLLIRLKDLTKGINAPESIGQLILDAKKQGERFQDKTLRTLDKALAASQRLGFLKAFVEPELKKLKQYVKSKKINIEKKLKETTESVQEDINAKVREIGETQLGIDFETETEKEKWIKKKVEDAKKLKKQIEDVVAKNLKRIGIASKLVREVLGLITAVAVIEEETRKAILGLETKARDLKKNVEDTFDNIDKPTEFRSPIKSAEFQKVLLDLGIPDVAKIPGIFDSFKNFGLTALDVKTLLQESDETYKKLIGSIKGLLANVEDIQTTFKELRESVQNDQQSSSKQKKIKAPRKQLRELPPTLQSVWNELSSIKVLLNKVKKDVEDWIRQQIAKQDVFLNKQKERLEDTIYKSIPIPVQVEDAENKKAVIEEKKAAIEQFKAKALKIKKQTEAVTLLTNNASKLASNIGKGDYTSGSNEVPLKNIAKAKFQFFTVDSKPGDAKYEQELQFQKTFEKEVDTLKEIESYVNVFKVVLEEVKSAQDKIKSGELQQDAQGKINSIIDQLKNDYRSILEGANVSSQLFQEKGVRGVSPQIDKLFSSLERVFSEKLQFADLLKELKTIKAVLQGNLLSETLNATPVVTALINLEQKYLQKTKTVLQKIVGAVPPVNEDNTQVPDGNEAIAELLGISVADVEREVSQKKVLTKVGEGYVFIKKPATSPNTSFVLGPLATANKSAKDAAKAARDEAARRIGESKIYKFLEDLYESIRDGNGSVISKLLAKIVDLLNKFEAFIRKQVTEVMTYVKKKIKKAIDDNKEALIAALERVNLRKDTIDEIATNAMFQVATQAFWLGATWTNSVGTTFQVFFVQPLKVFAPSTKVNGVEKWWRDYGQAFQKQLTGVQGIAIPNPATGIPPFFWKGYA